MRSVFEGWISIIGLPFCRWTSKTFQSIRFRRKPPHTNFSNLLEAKIRVRATRANVIPQVIYQQLEDQWIPIQLHPRFTNRRRHGKCDLHVPKLVSVIVTTSQEKEAVPPMPLIFKAKLPPTLYVMITKGLIRPPTKVSASSSTCFSSQSESPQHIIAVVNDDDSEVSDTQFDAFRSTPLSQSDDEWFKRKFISSPRSPLQPGMDSFQKETTPAIEIHSPAPILEATAQVPAPPHHTRTVEEVDDVLGRVILSQVNHIISEQSSDRLQTSYIPDSLTPPA